MSEPDGLLLWIQTFDEHISAFEDLCDGVALCRIVNQVIGNEDKSLEFEADSTSSNWIVAVKNIKELAARVQELCPGILDHPVDMSGLDCVAIARSHDVDEVKILAETVVALAVKCPNNKDFIERIMALDHVHQAQLMTCIQRVDTRATQQQQQQQQKLQEKTQPLNDPETQENVGQQQQRYSTSSNNSIASATAVAALEERVDELSQQVDSLQQERQSLKAALVTEQEARSTADTSRGNTDAGEAAAAMAREIAAVKRQRDDAIRVAKETQLQVDEGEERIIELQAQAHEFQVRLDETILSHDETIQALEDTLKDQADELDVAKARGSQLGGVEAKLAKYQERVHEFGQVQERLKQLEDQNAEYLDKIMDHEASMDMVPALKTQLDTYRDKVVDLETQVSEARAIGQVREADLKKAKASVEVLMEAKRALEQQVDVNKDEISQLEAQAETASSLGASLAPSGSIPPALQERISRLEHENARLRSSTSDGTDTRSSATSADIVELQSRLEEALSLKNKFESVTNNSTQESSVLLLKAENEARDARARSVDAQEHAQANEIASSAVLEETKTKLKAAEAQAFQLRLDKEKLENYVRQALNATQMKYKVAITTLNNILKVSEDEKRAMGALRDKQREAQKREERLMISAFYDVGLDIQRRVAKGRMNDNNNNNNVNEGGVQSERTTSTSSASGSSSDSPHHQPISWLAKERRKHRTLTEASGR